MKQSIILVLAIILISLLGCSEKGASPVVSNNSELQAVDIPQEALDKLEPYLTIEDGIPDGMLLASPNLNPPDINDTSFDIYSVTLLWGNFHNNHTDGTTPNDQMTKWDGGIFLNAEGFINPHFTILFEPNTDSLLPSVSPTRLDFASETSIGIDGINLLLFVKRNVTYIAAPQLFFETAPFTQSWEVQNLEHLFKFYNIDDQNGFVIHSRKIYRNPCKKGNFVGEWVRSTTTNNEGNFSAVWLDNNLGPTGYLVGEFWTNDDGSREFSGSLSGFFLTVVLAELHGTWNYEDPALCPVCGEGAGVLNGRFVMADGSGTGNLSGQFGSPGIHIDVKRLHLRGRWEINCPDSSDEDIRLN